MRVSAPSELRLQRFHRWMLLWLQWLAAFLTQARAFGPLSEQATATAHGWLDSIERALVNIIIFHSAFRVRRLSPPKHATRRRIVSQLRRAIIGSALRRALRSNDLHRRIAALSQNLDDLVTRLVKRLPRGLTRRRPHLARPEPRAERTVACVETALTADTS